MNNKTLVAADVISRFHLYGALSYLFEKDVVSSNSKIMFFVQFHRASGRYRIKKDDFDVLKSLHSEYYFGINYYFSVFLIILKIFSGNYKNIILIKARKQDRNLISLLLLLFPQKHISSVTIDEGLGTYSTEEEWNKSMKNEEKLFGYSIKKPKDCLKIKRRLKPIIKKFLFRNMTGVPTPNETFFLFSLDKKGSIVPNKNVIKAYRNFFILDRNEKNKLNFFEKDCILLLSDCLNIYLTNKEKEEEIYKKMFALLQTFLPSKEIILKPHPNELHSPEKFSDLKDVIVLKNDISAEALCNNNRISQVAGFCSTSLLSSSQVFGLKTISLVDYLDNALLNEDGKNAIKKFKKQTYKLKNLTFSLENLYRI